jgi:hypothetical protein
MIEAALGHSRLIDMLATPLRCPLCSESGVVLQERTNLVSAPGGYER